jgi:hypothetical protein
LTWFRAYTETFHHCEAEKSAIPGEIENAAPWVSPKGRRLSLVWLSPAFGREIGGALQPADPG